MGKMSAIIWLWGRNSLQNCATTLKSSFRARLSFVAGVTEAKGVRPSKPLFSSTNSLKSPLKIDLEPKTTFVAEIGNFCCFLATWTLKFPDRNFWHRDAPEAKKTRLFRKKVDFFDLAEYSALFKGGAQWQKFLPDPQCFDFNHFSAFL